MREAELRAERRARNRSDTRAVVAVLAAIVALGHPIAPGGARGAEPDVAAARDHLVRTLGGSPNDFELVYERASTVEHDASSLWAGKFLDHRSRASSALRSGSRRSS